ncbi:MAG: DUF4194 domain-containing protein [Epsilonproteobacteria bacterium]|nr:DUF4194 domain-containing protein [Campylobacterota bacterium]
MNKDAKTAIILLLKGIFYKGDNERAFFELTTNSYGSISDYFATIGLEVMVDEADGYAYLKNKDDEDEAEPLPKVIQKRELSYKVSLLLMLLRKKIAEFDMQSENEKAVVAKEDIVAEILLFLDLKFNEVKIKKEIDSTIKKVEDLGFLKRVKNYEDLYEIKSAIKSFVDIEFLENLDKKLQEYKEVRLWS